MIQILNPHLINKIAAGEVVERPLSVVKELTENAIDAGALTLTVEIRDGGLSYIRVTDDGCGIPADQVLLAFSQHATSKIKDIDDLSHIQTLGFRGEALASIASVSQVEMITKISESMTGMRIEMHGGTVVSKQELGCVDGTTITVSNLFFNTPARLKFLKKPAQEAGYVTDLIQKLALGYPNLAFRYISNGQSLISTNGNGDHRMTIYNIYGHEAAKNLILIENEFISGYIGKPKIARGSRSGENFFINGRYIKSDLLKDAVEEVYKTRLPTGKFPLCVLHLTVPADQVDVNVHPAKMEVRFANDQDVYNKVCEILAHSLSSSDLIPSVDKKRPRPAFSQVNKIDKANEFYTVNEIYKTTEIYEPNKPVNFVRPSNKPSKLDNTEIITPEYSSGLILSEEYCEKSPNLSESQQNVVPVQPSKQQELSTDFAIAFTDFNILGQIFNTYWLASKTDELFLIDQHAAHERVLYEEMLNTLITDKAALSQPLVEPIAIQCSPKELETALEYRSILEQFGFEFKTENYDTINILTVPVILKNPAEFTFFSQLLDKLETYGDVSPVDYIREELAMAACKTAIKAKDTLSVIEARGLIRRLLALENPYSCPHGRPTIVKLSQKEIERMFKRT